MSVKCNHLQYNSLGFCPICQHTKAMSKIGSKLDKQEFLGSAPTVFVGRFGYPNVNVGIMAPTYVSEDAWQLDSPRHWGLNNYTIPKLIEARAELINSRFTVDIKGKSRFLDISREVAMATKPVDVEITLKGKPSFRMSFHEFSAPSGPKAQMDKIGLASNPKVDRKVDYVVSDTDFKSAAAMRYLFDHGQDENVISRLLSIGNLGVASERKLVPTRWSITATDDSIARHLIERIKGYDQSGYFAFFGSYLGNHYLIMFFPEIWSYELFEASVPDSGSKFEFATDHEFYSGRKSYASSTAGGYYAARLPIVQKLAKMQRQASVLCIRLITKEYAVPLGVWVVREATRKTMDVNPIEFSSMELMLDYAKKVAKKRFNVDISSMFLQSHLLKKLKTQKKLAEF